MNIWKNRDWQPMLLKEIDEPFDSSNYIYEMKFDGIRAIVFATPNEVVIQSRNKQDLTYLFPELQDIKNLVKGKVIFDGEIVAFDKDKPSFNKLQQRNRLKNKSTIKSQSIDNPVVFVCFDILYQDEDLTNLTLIKRKKILDKYLDNDVFIKTKYINEEGINLFKKIKKLGLEGIVAKDKNSTYDINERSNNWIKIKNIKMEDFVIGGYTNNKNNTVSLILGEKRNNKLYYVGKVVMSKKKEIYEKLKKFKNKKSVFADYNEQGIYYIDDNIICEIEYLERTKSNHLRHPVFRKIKE